MQFQATLRLCRDPSWPRRQPILLDRGRTVDPLPLRRFRPLAPTSRRRMMAAVDYPQPEINYRITRS